MAPRPERADTGTVEELLAQIEALPAGDSATPPPRFSLWVPRQLTHRGQPIVKEDALALVVDALLDRQYLADGADEAADGCAYWYRWYEG